MIFISQEDMEVLTVTFLGTAGSIPTWKRSLPAIAIKYEGDIILFDCGEGTQRNFLHAHLGLNRPMKIFITHMHGDHVLGIPGILQTMSLLGREKPLEIYGPKGIGDFISRVRETVPFRLAYPVKTHEAGKGEVCATHTYTIVAAQVEHQVPCLAYAFIEKDKPGRFYPTKAKKLGIPTGPLFKALQNGKSVKSKAGRLVKPEEVMGPPRNGRRIAYSGDTSYSMELVRLADEADLLIHESTYGEELTERAEEEGHATPSVAARVAGEAHVKQVILTHISARYEDVDLPLTAARRLFKRVSIATDFTTVKIG